MAGAHRFDGTGPLEPPTLPVRASYGPAPPGTLHAVVKLDPVAKPPYSQAMILLRDCAAHPGISAIELGL